MVMSNLTNSINIRLRGFTELEICFLIKCKPSVSKYCAHLCSYCGGAFHSIVLFDTAAKEGFLFRV